MRPHGRAWPPGSARLGGGRARVRGSIKILDSLAPGALRLAVLRYSYYYSYYIVRSKLLPGALRRYFWIAFPPMIFEAGFPWIIANRANTCPHCGHTRPGASPAVWSSTMRSW